MNIYLVCEYSHGEEDVYKQGIGLGSTGITFKTLHYENYYVKD